MGKERILLHVDHTAVSNRYLALSKVADGLTRVLHSITRAGFSVDTVSDLVSRTSADKCILRQLDKRLAGIPVALHAHFQPAIDWPQWPFVPAWVDHTWLVLTPDHTKVKPDPAARKRIEEALSVYAETDLQEEIFRAAQLLIAHVEAFNQLVRARCASSGTVGFMPDVHGSIVAQGDRKLEINGLLIAGLRPRENPIEYRYPDEFLGEKVEEKLGFLSITEDAVYC